MLKTNTELADILIIDDDSSVVIALNKTLNKIGRIRFASDAKQAFLMINERPPDLILLDMELPDIRGLEVCSMLKSNARTEAIPVLFITSHIEAFFEEKVFDAGAADYIVKPLNPRVVASRVRTHLDYHRAIRLLDKLVHTDSMTGLANRRTFDEKMHQELLWARSEQKPLAVALIDIDEFKKYNDHFGHIAGDDCIKRIASLLGESAQRPGDLAARYGGEEFALILPNTDAPAAQSLLKAVLQRVEQLQIAHALQASHQMVTISIGFSVIVPNPSQHHQPEDWDVVQAADQALYKSKQKGRNLLSYQALDGATQIVSSM